MQFDDTEKQQKEYNMIMKQNSNIGNIIQVINKRYSSKSKPILHKFTNLYLDHNGKD